MMEHQNPLTEAVGPNLETGAVGGKRVISHRPHCGVAGCWIQLIMFPIVENDLEQPVLAPVRVITAGGGRPRGLI